MNQEQLSSEARNLTNVDCCLSSCQTLSQTSVLSMLINTSIDFLLIEGKQKGFSHESFEWLTMETDSMNEGTQGWTFSAATFGSSKAALNDE